MIFAFSGPAADTGAHRPAEQITDHSTATRT
jgi:hypothetical protein